MSLFPSKNQLCPEMVRQTEKLATDYTGRRLFLQAHGAWVKAATDWAALANRELFGRATYLGRAEYAWRQAAAAAQKVADGISRLPGRDGFNKEAKA